jgi:hypothetical protein
MERELIDCEDICPHKSFWSQEEYYNGPFQYGPWDALDSSDRSQVKVVEMEIVTLDSASEKEIISQSNKGAFKEGFSPLAILSLVSPTLESPSPCT